MQTTQRFQASDLQSISKRILSAAGTPQHIAVTVSEILVNANLSGHDSHGVLRIPSYLEQITKNSLVPAAEPAFSDETSNRFLVDGQKGFGHYTMRTAMQKAIEKAKQSTICCANFVNINHIGRLGEYAEQAAQSGCIGLITVGGGAKNSGTTVPFGGAEGRLGTNPIAVGVPTGDDTPFVLDFATSMVARGKILVADSQDMDLPDGWIVDKAGQPSTQTDDFWAGGHLLPLGGHVGGHKGYALSLFVCLLGGLSGQFDSKNSAMSGAFLQVIDIDAFLPHAEYAQNVRIFLDAMKTTLPAPDTDEVLVPGDFEYNTRVQRLAEGIDVPETICNQLQEWAVRLNVEL